MKRRLAPGRARRPARAFSLPELLLGVLVAAILLACALAPLQRSLQRARRAAASAALLELALRQESHRALHGSYARTPAALGWPQYADGAAPWPSPARAWYLLRLHSSAPPGGAADDYQAVALPLPAQAGEPCGKLGIDHLGRRSAAAPDCW